MGFERFHKRLDHTAKGNAATHKRIKKYLMPLYTFPMPCITYRKASNA